MSKSSQRRISRQKPKTKVSLGVIAEFQRRLDNVQANLASIWEEGFSAGLGVLPDAKGATIPVNPYLEIAEEEKPTDMCQRVEAFEDGFDG